MYENNLRKIRALKRPLNIGGHFTVLSLMLILSGMMLFDNVYSQSTKDSEVTMEELLKSTVEINVNQNSQTDTFSTVGSTLAGFTGIGTIVGLKVGKKYAIKIVQSVIIGGIYVLNILMVSFLGNITLATAKASFLPLNEIQSFIFLLITIVAIFCSLGLLSLVNFHSQQETGRELSEYKSIYKKRSNSSTGSPFKKS